MALNYVLLVEYWTKTLVYCNVPAFKTCAKQGYAVLASDGKGVRKVLRADFTSAPISLVPNTFIRVKSETPQPDGATAIVLLKDIEVLLMEERNSENFSINNEVEIKVLICPKENDNIRGWLRDGVRTVDFRKIHCYIEITFPADMGILALCGRRTVKVIKIPSVGILSIGDEMEEPGESLRPNHIYDSNRIVLLSLLRQYGYDPVDSTLQFCLINRVTMKPGKSTTFLVATINNNQKYFLCMSSNLATVPVIAHTLLLPFLNELHCNFNEPHVMQTSIRLVFSRFTNERRRGTLTRVVITLQI